MLGFRQNMLKDCQYIEEDTFFIYYKKKMMKLKDFKTKQKIIIKIVRKKTEQIKKTNLSKCAKLCKKYNLPIYDYYN